MPYMLIPLGYERPRRVIQRYYVRARFKLLVHCGLILYLGAKAHRHNVGTSCGEVDTFERYLDLGFGQPEAGSVDLDVVDSGLRFR